MTGYIFVGNKVCAQRLSYLIFQHFGLYFLHKNGFEFENYIEHDKKQRLKEGKE